MHHLYFPPCPIDGPIEPPVPFDHLGSDQRIPQKCSNCRFQFEGGCTRDFDKLQRYMHLDYGPCGIDGPTDPVRVENHYFISKVEVPKKCVDCPHLFFNLFEGFGCNKDGEKWRKGNRGLDWGYWKPDETYFQLPWPKITTPELMRLAGSNDRTAFVSVYRTLNKNKTLAEAVNDFGYLRELILHDREQRKQEAP